jgi:hypothetical protein
VSGTYLLDFRSSERNWRVVRANEEVTIIDFVTANNYYFTDNNFCVSLA